MKKVIVLVGAEIGVAMGGTKSPCLTTEYAYRWNSYGLLHVMEIQDMKFIGCAMRQRDRHGKDEGRAQRLEIRDGGKENSITTVNKDSMVMEYEDVEIHIGECFDAENQNSKTRRGRKMETKSNCLMAKDTDFMRYEGPRIIKLFGKKVRIIGIRRLTPTECSRLQTIPEWYKWECSDSQAYRMLGNGWTVEVIKHFFKELPWCGKKEAR